RPYWTMVLTAFPPAPPQPTTLIRAWYCCMSSANSIEKLIVPPARALAWFRDCAPAGLGPGRDGHPYKRGAPRCANKAATISVESVRAQEPSVARPRRSEGFAQPVPEATARCGGRRDGAHLRVLFVLGGGNGFT